MAFPDRFEVWASHVQSLYRAPYLRQNSVIQSFWISSYVFLSKTLYLFPTEQNGSIGKANTEAPIINCYTLNLSDIFLYMIQLAASLSV